MTDEVADSTDWLPTPLSAIAAVENALRCQVCKDFYKTPMITNCSHTFCSICIRRALSNDGKCPLCRSPEQELKLRSNWSLEETVDAFVKARPATLALASKGAAGSAGKRNAEEDPSQNNETPGGKRLRTSARLRGNRVKADDAYKIQDEEVVAITDDDDEYTPDHADGLVPCPVCQKRMKDWAVFKHLESCPGPTPQKATGGEASKPSTLTQLQRQPTKPVERLPALNYSILKDQALRKKLGDLGISMLGSRQQLQKRHQEWITLWNANCDAARPKKRAELLRDLDAWERTQTAGSRSGVTVKDKEFDGAAWAAKHDSSFKDLIASARKSRMEAKKKTEEAAESASAEGPVSTTFAQLEAESSGGVKTEDTKGMAQYPAVSGGGDQSQKPISDHRNHLPWQQQAQEQEQRQPTYTQFPAQGWSTQARPPTLQPGVSNQPLVDSKHHPEPRPTPSNVEDTIRTDQSGSRNPSSAPWGLDNSSDPRPYYPEDWGARMGFYSEEP